MLGAVAGDIIGSRFEGHPGPPRDFMLFHPHCRFTDDTACTIAVADALLHGRGRRSYGGAAGLRPPDRSFHGPIVGAADERAAVHRHRATRPGRPPDRAAIAARRIIAMRRSRPATVKRIFNPVWSVEVAMALAAAAASAAAFVSAGAWPAEVRAPPQIAAAAGVVMSLGALLSVWTKPPQEAGASAAPGAQDEELHCDITTDFGDLSESAVYLRGLRYLLLCCAFLAMAWAVGVLPATPLFILLCMT